MGNPKTKIKVNRLLKGMTGVELEALSFAMVPIFCELNKAEGAGGCEACNGKTLCEAVDDAQTEMGEW